MGFGCELKRGNAQSEPSSSRRCRSHFRTFSSSLIKRLPTLSSACFPPRAEVKTPHSLLSVPLFQGLQEGRVRRLEAGKPSPPILFNGSKMNHRVNRAGSVSEIVVIVRIILLGEFYIMTQPSWWGVTLPVCQRQMSTASCRASATKARFFWRAAACGFNNRCRQRCTALHCG